MMNDLISMAAAIERMKSMAGCATCDNYNYVRCRACIWDDAMNIVEEMSEVEDVPVVHGRWKSYHAGPQTYPFWDSKCSVCDYKVAMLMKDWDYCPHCGAKMDAEQHIAFADQNGAEYADNPTV